MYLSLSMYENQAVSPEIRIAYLYHKRLVPNSQALECENLRIRA
jgi:hypothetical protein